MRGSRIEMKTTVISCTTLTRSPPIRVRGLKSIIEGSIGTMFDGSHRIRVRRLKMFRLMRALYVFVALYIGALIRRIQYGCAKLFYYASYSKLTLFDFKRKQHIVIFIKSKLPGAGCRFYYRSCHLTFAWGAQLLSVIFVLYLSPVYISPAPKLFCLWHTL